MDQSQPPGLNVMTRPTDLHKPFELLITQHRGIVFKIVNTYCFTPDDRMDLAQEIMVQLWRAFSKYDGQRSFPTWMYRIALNVAISHVRTTVRRGVQPVRLDEELHDLPDHVAVELEFLYALEFAIERARREADESGRAEVEALRRRFLGAHLGAWIAPFAARVEGGARTAFYRELALMVRRFVELEARADSH